MGVEDTLVAVAVETVSKVLGDREAAVAKARGLTEEQARARAAALVKARGGAKWKGSRARRRRAEALQATAEMTAAVVAEQIRRGALFDPRGLFYAEDGEELYTRDGPLREDVLGNLSPAWVKGEVKRTWSKGDLKPMSALTEAEAQAITSIEVVMKNAVAGDGQVDRILKIRLAPREKYVELAARYHGLLIDRSETTINVNVVGAKLDAARRRAAGLLPDIETKALAEGETT
jgi:hypothetical protein